MSNWISVEVAFPKKIKLVFEVELPTDVLISEQDLEEAYQGDWYKFLSELYREEGMFFSEPLELVQVRPI